MKKFVEWLKRLFGIRPAGEPHSPPPPVPAPAPVPAPVPAPAPVYVPPPPPPEPAFVETFRNLDNWVVSTWSAPGTNATHTGGFASGNVKIVDGCLRLQLDQKMVDGKVKSSGGEVTTKQKFGYGRYEFIARASSTAAAPGDLGEAVSGSITGIFNYGPASVTEIDIEVEGNERHHLTQCTTWKGESKPNEHTKVSPAAKLPHEMFFKYAFVWLPDRIDFYRDDVLVATHTKVVPSEPCPVLLNHWGTNNVNWGGEATVDTPRYMFVSRFSFTPL